MKTNVLTMKAAYVDGYGSSEYINVREISRPLPKANEILVQVIAASVTRADIMMLSGKPYLNRLFIGLTKPKNPIPGTGFSGIIEAIGKDVKNFEVGDEVFGNTTLGFSANAEYLSISEEGVVALKPTKMSHEEAATYNDGPVTSYNFLKEVGEIKAGQKVLINGASGALGTAAVQIAKHFGAEVTGVCSGKNVELVKSLGADHVIDYTQEDFTQSEQKYDLIYDTIGKSSFAESKRVLKDDGQYLSPVMDLGLLMTTVWTGLFSSKKAKFAATGLRKDHELNEILRELLDIHQQGGLKTVIDRRYKLTETAKAHEHIASGHKVGNVVINIA